MAADLDVRQLRVLLELERAGSMRAAAAATGYSTSAVSAQLAGLQRDAGAALLEPDGRGVRLTPAGRRLAGHARTIVAAVDAARADLAADGPVAGEVRLAAYSSALARECLQAVQRLRVPHPDLRVGLLEAEPEEVLAAVADGTVDVALAYDYSLVPLAPPAGVHARPLSAVPMVLARPAGMPADVGALAREPWIVNSRGADDEELLRRVAARHGFVPEVRHRADALDLVVALIAGGLGVALLPGDAQPAPGVELTPIPDVAGTRRMYAAVRAGHADWPPVARVLEALAELAGQSSSVKT